MKVTVKAANNKARILRERDAYVDKYNKQKAEHTEQVNKFTHDYDNYVITAANNVRELLKDDIAALPGLRVQVTRYNEYRVAGKPTDYVIQIDYTDPKAQNAERVRSKTGYSRLNGVSWRYYIYLEGDYSSPEASLKLRKEPEFYGQLLESSDLPVLKATCDLFMKMENIDWEAVLNKVASEIPQRVNYVTTPDPGMLHTSEYENRIDAYDLNRIIGKDVWIKVRMDREQSYDRWSDYSNAPGVDGNGWVQILSQTDKFYVFRWLADRDKQRYTDNEFTEYSMNKAFNNTYKLKKIYFKVIRPLEYYSTDELRFEVVPDYHKSDETEEVSEA